MAWWLWALGLAAAASFTTNPLVLLLLVGVATVVVMARRSDQPWARSFRLYVLLGVVIVVVRVVFRIVFGGDVSGTRAARPARGPAARLGARASALLGPVTREALLAGLYDGLRLATIVICVGAANSLANPKRLLRSVPPALYEIGTALVVAVTVLPAVRRQRAPGAGRAGAAGGRDRPGRAAAPVPGARCSRTRSSARWRWPPGMDTRGYGRPAALDARPAPASPAR